MKVIALLGLVFGGFYFYSNATAPIEIHSYQDLLYKVEREPVTTNEMKLGANMLALIFCNDTSLQESGGKSVKECLKTYANMRDMCESRIFNNKQQLVEDTEQVISTSKRFAACVGIE